MWAKGLPVLVQEVQVLVLVVLAQAQAQAAGLLLQVVYPWAPESSCG